ALAHGTMKFALLRFWSADKSMQSVWHFATRRRFTCLVETRFAREGAAEHGLARMIDLLAAAEALLEARRRIHANALSRVSNSAQHRRQGPGCLASTSLSSSGGGVNRSRQR